jgi:hypothetical protein
MVRFQEAQKILEDIGDRRSLADCLLGIAAVQRAMGASAEGRRSLERAYALMDEIGVRPTPRQIAWGLAEA